MKNEGPSIIEQIKNVSISHYDEQLEFIMSFLRNMKGNKGIQAHTLVLLSQEGLRLSELGIDNPGGTSEERFLSIVKSLGCYMVINRATEGWGQQTP